RQSRFPPLIRVVSWFVVPSRRSARWLAASARWRSCSMVRYVVVTPYLVSVSSLAPKGSGQSSMLSSPSETMVCPARGLTIFGGGVVARVRVGLRGDRARIHAYIVGMGGEGCGGPRVRTLGGGERVFDKHLGSVGGVPCNDPDRKPGVDGLGKRNWRLADQGVDSVLHRVGGVCHGGPPFCVAWWYS